MPETLEMSNYYVDKATKTALLALRAGHMASFYLYCDASAGKAGLSAVRATSASSMTATEKGKAQRKEMGVSQFARGILFCKGPSEFIFVRYGGNLAKTRMAYTLGVMYKRGGFDGLLRKGLRDAEVYEKAELEVADESGVTPLQQLLSAAEATDAPTEDSGVAPTASGSEPTSSAPTRSGEASAPVVAPVESPTLSPTMSKAELLVAMEGEFLNEEALEEEMLEVMLEGVAPLAELLGLDVKASADLTAFADTMLAALDGVKPDEAEALLLTAEGQAISKMVSETVASARPLREAGDDPTTKLTAKVGQLLGGPLKEALDGSPPSAFELATRPVRVGYKGKQIELLAAKVVEDGRALPEGGTARHVKRAHVQGIADQVEALDELITEIMEDEGDSELDDLLDELDDGYLDAMTEIDARLEALVATPVAVIDEIALSDLREAMEALDEQLELRKGHQEVLKFKAETQLRTFAISRLHVSGTTYRLKTCDADLSGASNTDFLGDPQPLLVLPAEVLQRELLEPVDRLVDTARRRRVPPSTLAASIRETEQTLHRGFATLRDWKTGVIVFRTAQIAQIQDRLREFGRVSLEHERATGAGLPEYQADDRLVAEAMPCGDPPMALRDLWVAAEASFKATFRALTESAAVRRFSMRLPRSPYPALVWHAGSPFEDRWTNARGKAAADERGYGPVLAGRFMMGTRKEFMVDLPGGASTLAGLKSVIGKAGYNNIYLMGPDLVETTVDVVEATLGKTKYKAIRMVGGDPKLSDSDVDTIVAALKELRSDRATFAYSAGMEGLPSDMQAYGELERSYAKARGVDRKANRHRGMGLEALLDNPASRDAFIASARASGAAENLMFYVAVTPAMAPHRLLFPELTPMFGTSGVDRIQWIHDHFIVDTGPMGINVSGGVREQNILRMQNGTISASAEIEYKATAKAVVAGFGEALSRVFKLTPTTSS